jgi:GT2 family glycosyltransferase
MVRRSDVNTVVDVAVIVCAFSLERWSALTACVESVLQQTCQPYQVIVVIDHNADLFECARRQFAGEVKVVENTGERGLSGARNSGLTHVNEQFVAFLDDDAVADPDWLEQLLLGFDTSNVLGVGGCIQPLWAGGRPAWFPAEFNWVVGCTYAGMPTSTGQIRNLIGASMCLRREVLVTLGGFSSNLGRTDRQPEGCEETDLCIRARRRWPEGRFVYQPRAIVSHLVPPSRVTWSYFRSRCYAEGCSKAKLGRRVGANAALRVERKYVAQTLSRALLRCVGRGLSRRDRPALTQGAAIVVGVAATAAGYIRRSVA